MVKYTATDFSSWDPIFEQDKVDLNKWGALTRIAYGNPKDITKIDLVCNALELPFPNNTFDCYLSFEVLEHINDPSKFLSEAYRVLRNEGLCIISIPFLYREHGSVEHDFQRFTIGGLKYLAEQTSFQVEKIFTYSCFGTTFAGLTNQFLIRKIVESKSKILKFVLLSIAPIFFFSINLIGFIIDHFDQDSRFAYRYHLVLRK